MNNTIIEKIKNRYYTIRSTPGCITAMNFLSETIKKSIILVVVFVGLLSIFSITIQDAIAAIDGWFHTAIGLHITEKKIIIPLIVCVLALTVHWFKRDLFLTRETIFQNELIYDSKRVEMNLNICRERIEAITDRIEALKTEKEFIISCTPIPIVVTVLAYIIEKAGFLTVNWYVYISLCLLSITAYIFFCINHIRKARKLFGRKRSWERTRSKLERYCQADGKVTSNIQHEQHSG